ncbi:MAG TPA: serine/threonine-protein kinase [Kofleriaceae bacterium]|nr:serine/threonine-protein kinase [Kofleriaceae bacterium]
MATIGGAATLIANQRFGRYTVHDCLDRGGMGEVWLASVEGPGGFCKQVVLKTVRADLSARRDLVDMLIREAALAARLSHPNLVQVFDLDQVDGTYFFAMEYVPGRTLAAILRQAIRGGTALPPWFMASLVASCCDGLQYAHDLTDDSGNPLGLVHRDISLGNIMVSTTGNVTILDFGIAIAAGAGAHAEPDLLMGKFQYMPSEAVRGEIVDRRCDVYALGVVLLVGLTATMPYDGAGDRELLRQIAAGPPRDLSARLRHLPPELRGAITQAMSHDRDARFSDAAMLAAELREYLHIIGMHPTKDDLARYVAGLFNANATEKSPVVVPTVEVDPSDELSEISIDVDELETAGEGVVAHAVARERSWPVGSTAAPAVRASPPPPPPLPLPRLPSASAVIGKPPPDDGFDPFTSHRKRPSTSLFDGWSRDRDDDDARRPPDEADDPPPSRRWPWSR